MSKCFSHLFLSLVAAGALQGCGGDVLIKEANNERARGAAVLSARADELIDQRVKPSPVLVKNSGMWLGGKSIPLSDRAALPAVFNSKVTVYVPGRLNMPAIGEQITKATGLPVQVTPDVMISTAKLSGTTTQANSQAGLMPGQVPGQTPGFNWSVYAAQQLKDDQELSYTGPLTALLDLVASRMNISWEYKSGKIVFSRLVTRTFTLNAVPGGAVLSSSVGKTGQSSSGTNGGTMSTNTGTFNSQNSVSMDSKFSMWESLDAAISSMMSPVGKYSLSQATGTLVITDTKDHVERIAKYVENENRQMTRQVAVRLELISLTDTRAAEYGTDINLVLNKLNSDLTSSYAFSITSPSTLTSTLAGAFGLSIITPNPSSNLARFKGSTTFLQALSTIGTANLLTTASVMTLNRQPAPVSLTDQVTYLASTTPGAGSTTGGASTVPGLTPGIVTTGYMFQVLPTVTDDNTVILQFSFDISQLTDMGTQSTGSGATLQSIQTPEVSGKQGIQRVKMKAGQTLVLTGFERSSSKYNKRSTSETADVMGSTKGDRQRESLMILLTPVIVDEV